MRFVVQFLVRSETKPGHFNQNDPGNRKDRNCGRPLHPVTILMRKSFSVRPCLHLSCFYQHLLSLVLPPCMAVGACLAPQNCHCSRLWPFQQSSSQPGCAEGHGHQDFTFVCLQLCKDPAPGSGRALSKSLLLVQHRYFWIPAEQVHFHLLVRPTDAFELGDHPSCGKAFIK